MNKVINKYKMLLLIIGLIGLTSFTTDLKDFCSYFESEQLDGCKMVLNNYFEVKEQTQAKFEDRFKESEELINDLNKLDCIDSCFFELIDGKRYTAMSEPPQTSIIIYKINPPDTVKYGLNMILDDNKTRVSSVTKWQ